MLSSKGTKKGYKPFENELPPPARAHNKICECVVSATSASHRRRGGMIQQNKKQTEKFILPSCMSLNKVERRNPLGKGLDLHRKRAHTHFVKSERFPVVPEISRHCLVASGFGFLRVRFL
eukprot:654914-Amphidinium_carterae.1